MSKYTKKPKATTAKAPVQKVVTPTPAQPSDLLTIAEVAIILRVDGTTLRRWVKQGTLDAVILPHVNERQAYRVKRETLDAILATHA
jgi:excisionase family DNA binding protein